MINFVGESHYFPPPPPKKIVGFRSILDSMEVKTVNILIFKTYFRLRKHMCYTKSFENELQSKTVLGLHCMSAFYVVGNNFK